ncbi:MAG: hypothetical protein Q9217_002399 [Psora testacea]
MASQMDALQSFTYLTDSIPQWITDLDDLIIKCEIQYERFTRITAHGEVKLTRKKKHDSTESLRPGKDGITTATLKNNKTTSAIAANNHIPTSSPALRPDASTADFAIQELRRKRRAGSDLSGAPSTQTPYRMKSMVVVYYDSDIQNAFETLVKNIAGARNNLRKGKNSATFKARIASIGIGPPSLPSSRGLDDFPILGPKMMTPTLARTKLGRQSGGNAMKCFEDADRDLEEAQNLCERAAHQFLRDGDCHTEIDGTRKRFKTCEDLAKIEVERLRKEAEAEKVQEKEDEAEEKTLVGEPTPPAVEEGPLVVNVAAKTDQPPLKQFSFAGTGAIEIDDGSDAESMNVDLSAIRRTVRSARG